MPVRYGERSVCVRTKAGYVSPADEVIIKGFVLKVNRVYPQPVKKLLTVAKKILFYWWWI